MTLSRREFLVAAGLGVGALGVAGCDAGHGGLADDSAGARGRGSTLVSTWVDPQGDGQLQMGPGEALIERLELAGSAHAAPGLAARRELARLVHLTDAHVLDASSPARVPFLARLGPPVQSTFRPQETLTAQVLAGAVNAIRGFGPDVVIQGGDLIDNDQANELGHALGVLDGGRISPGSGPDGYYGVQLASDPDPFYYRPDIDAPRHPGMLAAAIRPFRSPGLGARWLPVLGDHDALVNGELVPDGQTRALALGDRALWELPTNLKLPDGFKLSPSGSPDGPPDPGFVASFLAQALAGPTVRVPASPARAELAFDEVIGGLWRGSRAPRQPGISAAASARAGTRLDYVCDIGDELRLITLDLVRRGGGSGGLVAAGQPDWLLEQIESAGARWIIVVTHFPLPDADGGESLLEVMDHAPRVIAALAGHIHRNSITPRAGQVGAGYWLITTASLIDFPQQCRALALSSTADGGVVLDTWMLDHAGAGALGGISRQLAYLDAQGGRPMGFSGSRGDRNVRLYRGRVPSSRVRG